MEIQVEELDWEKGDGLIPAIVQDFETGEVLMLGYMNQDALRKTLEVEKVTFWSRKRQKLWTKGETSGNFLHFREISPDCDMDTLLVKAVPEGPVCHLQTATCFSDSASYEGLSFLAQLERVVRSRRDSMPPGSYTTRLFEKGVDEISKKLGEEAVELIVSVNQNQERTVSEAADLIYHLIVFLTSQGLYLSEVVDELQERHS